MYNKILVPMDGSELAECSLEHVREIAKGCHTSEVILLAVVEQVTGPGYTWGAVASGEQMAAEAKKVQAKAAEYLKGVARELTKDGLGVQTRIVAGMPAEAILDFAKKNDVALIIMSTHGRSGIARWAMGSVADRVLRNSSIPVMVVSPKGSRVG
ncbi:MAG: universal stress protein [Chloroflexota bacterium]